MTTTIISGHDRSLLLKIAGASVFTPLVKRLPAWVKPNFITVTGFCSVLLFSYFSLRAARVGFRGDYLLAAVVLLIYLVADNLDGMHARATGQTSRLGGFLDQWLDAISLLVIAMSVLSLVQVSRRIFLLVMFLLATINILLYHEQTVSEFFNKPPVGPNEFIFLIVSGYLFAFVFHDALAMLHHATMLRIVNLIVFAAVIISVVVIVQALARIWLSAGSCVVPVLLHAAVVVSCTLNHSLSAIAIGSIVIATNALYIGKMLFSIYSLVRGAPPAPITSLLVMPDAVPEAVAVHSSEETFVIDDGSQ